ncbi:uncharacterized protein LOC131887114 [Tigriopus californicus]|uniref:uncharacterized protein LOC131887114 n=1 Tax=Tigriopus californicus TaxID=6832 RepID=UPI0027D9F279|nr:uncharacterized protein LOC131887114 [Tigriopus californicus]XP_059091623.1 uncharacterized protein LOC131887114 [Tigriopus californicus]
MLGNKRTLQSIRAFPSVKAPVSILNRGRENLKRTDNDNRPSRRGNDLDQRDDDGGDDDDDDDDDAGNNDKTSINVARPSQPTLSQKRLPITRVRQAPEQKGSLQFDKITHQLMEKKVLGLGRDSYLKFEELSRPLKVRHFERTPTILTRNNHNSSTGNQKQKITQAQHPPPSQLKPKPTRTRGRRRKELPQGQGQKQLKSRKKRSLQTPQVLERSRKVFRMQTTHISGKEDEHPKNKLGKDMPSNIGINSKKVTKYGKPVEKAAGPKGFHRHLGFGTKFAASEKVSNPTIVARKHRAVRPDLKGTQKNPFQARINRPNPNFPSIGKPKMTINRHGASRQIEKKMAASTNSKTNAMEKRFRAMPRANDRKTWHAIPPKGEKISPMSRKNERGILRMKVHFQVALPSEIMKKRQLGQHQQHHHHQRHQPQQQGPQQLTLRQQQQRPQQLTLRQQQLRPQQLTLRQPQRQQLLQHKSQKGKSYPQPFANSNKHLNKRVNFQSQFPRKKGMDCHSPPNESEIARRQTELERFRHGTADRWKWRGYVK